MQCLKESPSKLLNKAITIVTIDVLTISSNNQNHMPLTFMYIESLNVTTKCKLYIFMN